MTRPGGPCASNEVSTHARVADGDSNHAWHIVVAAEVRGARWHCANSGSTFGVSQKGTDFHGGETGDPRDGHDAIGVPAAHKLLAALLHSGRMDASTPPLCPTLRAHSNNGNNFIIIGYH